MFSDKTAALNLLRTKFSGIAAKAFVVARNEDGLSTLNALSTPPDYELGDTTFRAVVFGRAADLSEREEGEAIEGTNMDPKEITGKVRQFSKYVRVTQEMMESGKIKAHIQNYVAGLGQRAVNHPIKTMFKYLTNGAATTYDTELGKTIDITCVTDDAMFTTVTHPWGDMSVINKIGYTIAATLDKDEVTGAIDDAIIQAMGFRDSAGQPFNFGLTVNELRIIADHKHQQIFNELRTADQIGKVPSRGDAIYAPSGYHSYCDVRAYDSTNSKHRMYVGLTTETLRPFFFKLVPGYPKSDMEYNFITQSHRFAVLTKYMFAWANPAGMVYLLEA